MKYARHLILAFAATCGVFAGGKPASAAYPDRIIKLIVPQAPGSSTDSLARIVGAELGNQLGQTVVIENRPGGALTIGLDLVAKSPPDGYTIGMGPVGALAITRHLVKKLPYDIERDFQPIIQITRGQLMLAVAPKMGINSVAELIALAKSKPGTLVNVSSSNGSPGHVGGELFKYMTGTEILHVPYRGGAMAITDVISGQVHMIFESLPSITPFAKSGEVRALAVSGAKRSPVFPDLPTLTEAGVPGYEATTWNGLIGPAGLSKEIVATLNTAVNRALVTKNFKDRFGVIGDEAAGGTPEDFAATIAKDSAKWADVIKRAGTKLD
jgi:tripartite-type tricarboxylate transporter receptor subunit TctC